MRKGVMVMRTLAVTLALVSAPFLFAQEDPKIQDAVRALGADNFEDREKATADLKKIGAPALDALKKAAAESQDPEVQARAKKLIQEIDKPAPQKRAPARAPGAFFGSRVSIRRSGDATVYQLQPAEGDAIEFHRGPGDKVRLVYPDGKGGKAEAEAESVEKFVETHKELAEKYGVTKDGIEYGGTRMNFNAPVAIPAIPRFQDLPGVPMPPDFGEFKDVFTESEELRKAFEDLRRQAFVPRQWAFGSPVHRGAEIGPVPDVLRAHLSIPEGRGLVVVSVYEGSTAAAAGLKKHDILLEIDGKAVSQPGDVRALLKRDSKVKALRSGKEIDLSPAPPPKKDY